MPKVGAVLVSWPDLIARPQNAQWSGSRVFSASLMGVCASQLCRGQGSCQHGRWLVAEAYPSLRAAEEHEHERPQTLLRSRSSRAGGRRGIGAPDGKFDSDGVPRVEVRHGSGR